MGRLVNQFPITKCSAIILMRIDVSFAGTEVGGRQAARARSADGGLPVQVVSAAPTKWRDASETNRGRRSPPRMPARAQTTGSREGEGTVAAAKIGQRVKKHHESVSHKYLV